MRCNLHTFLFSCFSKWCNSQLWYEEDVKSQSFSFWEFVSKSILPSPGSLREGLGSKNANVNKDARLTGHTSFWSLEICIRYCNGPGSRAKKTEQEGKCTDLVHKLADWNKWLLWRSREISHSLVTFQRDQMSEMFLRQMRMLVTNKAGCFNTEQ